MLTYKEYAKWKDLVSYVGWSDTIESRTRHQANLNFYIEELEEKYQKQMIQLISEYEDYLNR